MGVCVCVGGGVCMCVCVWGRGYVYVYTLYTLQSVQYHNVVSRMYTLQVLIQLLRIENIIMLVKHIPAYTW